VRELRPLVDRVDVVFSGRHPDKLWDVEVFEPFRAFRGLTFITDRGRINYLKTALQLDFGCFISNITQLTPRDYDLVVTDFEPVSAWFAKRHKIESVGLGHQYVFKYNIPIPKPDLLGLSIARNFAPADHPLGIHWYHFNQPIIPPILPEMEPADEIEEDRIVVYLPFEERKDIINFFKRFPEYRFRYYTSIDRFRNFKNIDLCPLSRENFLNELKTCYGVVCNSGFQLTSEVIHLGKKLLVKPVNNQVEQESNALVLKQLGLGDYMKTLDEDAFNAWIDEPPCEPVRYPNVARNLAEWLSRGNWSEVDALVDELWSEVDYEFELKPVEY
jgi:uncharacterized protein (TIGR00661 family)